jgi:hypothetical protein
MSVSHSFPIRMPAPLKKRLEAAAAHLELSEQDTARLLLNIGLAHLDRIEYNLPAAILAHSQARQALRAKTSKPTAKKKPKA